MLSLTGLICSAVALGPPVVIDERFGDWGPADLVATDPSGDSASSNGSFDLTRVWARGEGKFVHLSFEFDGAPKNLQSGDFADGSPSILITKPGGESLAIFLRSRRVFELDGNGDPITELGWGFLDFALLPTVAANRYEARIRVGRIGLDEGDTALVNFGVPSWTGTIEDALDATFFGLAAGLDPDTLDAPAEVGMGPAPEPAGAVFDPSRAPGAGMRIASINMLAGGLFDASRGAEIDRVIDAMDADVYLLQEQNGSVAAVESRLAGIDPLGGGEAWTAVTDPSTSAFGSDFIVSHLPVRPVVDPPFTNDFAAAVVGGDVSSSVLILSIHPKCCGHIGSTEDAQRIAQTQEMVELIARFRASRLGEGLAPFASVPVVVAGDWNLVGSDEPRRLLTDPALTPSLDHAVLLRPDGRDAITWRDLDGFGFSPGLLDLVAFSPQNLEILRGFVFDSGLMDEATRSGLGLEPNDTRFSDHLGLVIDVSRPVSLADTDRDGVLAFPDVVAYLELFFEGASGADLEPDGDRDFNDLLLFLEAFEAGTD